MDNSNRLLPQSPLPRQYAFLTRHAAKSFVTYYTYNFADAAFCRKLTVPHGLSKAPIHDMWVMQTTSVTGNPATDFPVQPTNIYHSPAQIYSGLFPSQALQDSYYCSADATNVYIQVNHVTVGTGTKHVYFHVKLYIDQFNNGIYFDGERT